MPVKRCTLPNGRKGFKWGDSGKCYPYRSQALAQGRAILASQNKKKNDD